MKAFVLLVIFASSTLIHGKLSHDYPPLAAEWLDTPEAPPVNLTERAVRALQDDSDGFLATLIGDEDNSRNGWRTLRLIVAGTYTITPPPNNQNPLRPGNFLTGFNAILNQRQQRIGSSTQTCIRATNYVCTWVLFSASIAKSGCDIMAQGIFIRGEGGGGTLSVPVTQYATITGGTGPCRGILGEIRISPRTLENPPSLWDYELIYRIDT